MNLFSTIKLGRKAALAAAAAAGLTITALSGLLYQNLAQWRQLENSIRHTGDFLRSSEELYSQVLAAESAVRAYIISSSPEALKDYDRAASAQEREYASLAKSERSHRECAEKLAGLARMLEQRRTELNETVLERRTKGLSAARLPEMTRKGRQHTSEIEKVITELQTAEQRDLAALQLEAKAGEGQRDRLITAIFLTFFLMTLGALIAAVSVARKHRLAKNELAEAHARLNSVLDAAHHVAIIATDLNGTITLFNTGAEKMLGYKAEELVGLKTPEVIHYREEVETRSRELTERLGRPITGFGVFIEALRQGSFESREWTYVTKDGRQFPVELIVTGVKDHSGKLIGFLGLATDISTRKNSQLKLRKLSAAVKASPTSIVITDKDGRIEFANPKFFQLTGYSERELVGQNPRLIASGKTPKSTYKEMWDTLLSGRIWDGELLNRKKNGELFWEHASISPVKDPLGNITNFVAVKLDITDQKLAQKEVEKARDAAVELARLKSEFLANMSHEIRTPMNAIIGMTGLLLDTQLTAQQRDYVKTVNGAGEALLDIINDILDFSKIESGKLSIEKLDFSLRETVETTADLLAPRAQAKNIKLAHFMEEGLPTAITGDQGRLRQVLLNLIGNAVKFTETGEVVLRVTRVKAGAGNATLKFEVKDTGIGIPLGAQKNLFQVFTQADTSTTRKYGGTGLGLSISRKLVDLMGGEIGLESEPGKGSTFWFTLPFGLPSSPLPEERPAAAPEQRPAARECRKYFRVLVAEDNIVNQKVSLQQLEKLGYEADVAANGLEVLEALKRRPYDLVLMDCQMPEMDGFQATQEIRRSEGDSRHTPIVALTANALEGDQERCLAAGMDGYIPKPVRMEKLAEMLARWDTTLDGAVIRDISELAGPENPGFLADLANTYLGDLQSRLGNIRSAVKAGNAENLRQAAHALKGSSGNVGAKRMQKICLLLEGMGKSGDLQGTAETLAAMEKEAVNVCDALAAIAAEKNHK